MINKEDYELEFIHGSSSFLLCCFELPVDEVRHIVQLTDKVMGYTCLTTEIFNHTTKHKRIDAAIEYLNSHYSELELLLLRSTNETYYK